MQYLNRLGVRMFWIGIFGMVGSLLSFPFFGMFNAELKEGISYCFLAGLISAVIGSFLNLYYESIDI